MCLLNGWIGESVMSGLYEELEEYLKQDKAVALATVVRGEEHVGPKLLVLADKSRRCRLGYEALDDLGVEDAVRAIWSGDARRHTYAIGGPEGALAFEVFLEGL